MLIKPEVNLKKNHTIFASIIIAIDIADTLKH